VLYVPPAVSFDRRPDRLLRSGDGVLWALSHMPGVWVTGRIPTNGQPVPLGKRDAGPDCSLHTWGGSGSSGARWASREGLDSQSAPIARRRLVCCACLPTGVQAGGTPALAAARRSQPFLP
jgi:hypothetical protein